MIDTYEPNAFYNRKSFIAMTNRVSESSKYLGQVIKEW